MAKAGTKLPAVSRMARALETIEKSYPNMTMKQLRVLFQVLDKPGVKMADLVRELDVPKATLSLAARSLGSGAFHDDGSGSQKRGLDLISAVDDPFELRSKLLAPTARGRALGEKLEKILGEGDGTT